MKQESKVITQYVNKRNKRVGVLAAAINPEGKVTIGWSLARKPKNLTPVQAVQLVLVGGQDALKQALGDKFNPYFGTELAISRTQANMPLPPPQSLYKDAIKFQERASRYFKHNDLNVI